MLANSQTIWTVKDTFEYLLIVFFFFVNLNQFSMIKTEIQQAQSGKIVIPLRFA